MELRTPPGWHRVFTDEIANASRGRIITIADDNRRVIIRIHRDKRAIDVFDQTTKTRQFEALYVPDDIHTPWRVGGNKVISLGEIGSACLTILGQGEKP